MNPQLAWNISARDKSGPAFQSFDRRVRTSDAGVRRLGTSMETVGAVRNNFAAAAAALAGIGASAAAIRGVVSEMSRLAKDADKVGLLTDEFQRLQFGFELAGVEASAFTKAMEQFNKRLTEAQTGTGNLKKILDANNVSLFNADGSMKSVNQLLGEYAELIKNAESSQNRLYLATEAFGRSGGDMVLALRNGADGVRDLATEADNAGGVIEDELLRVAEEVDDDWARVARNFEINWKTAVLNVVNEFKGIGTAIDNLEKGLGNFGNSAVFKWLNDKFGGDAALGPGGVVTGPEAKKINDELSNAAYIDLFSDLGTSSLSPPPKTAIPVTPPKKGSSKSKETISDARKVIAALTEELEVLGLSEEQQRVVQELRKAGVDAASAEGQAIIGLVGAITQEEAALKALKEQQEAVADSLITLADYGFQAFEIWATGAEDMEQQLVRLGLQLAKLAAQALLLGEGPLAGLFGTVGGGLFSGFGSGSSSQLAGVLSGSFAGLFAEGGTLGAGQWGIAGEKGPEPVVGPAKIIPMDRLPAAAAARGQHVTVDVRTEHIVGLDDDGKMVEIAKRESRKISRQGFKEFNEILPDRMQDISRNPRRRGR